MYKGRYNAIGELVHSHFIMECKVVRREVVDHDTTLFYDDEIMTMNMVFYVIKGYTNRMHPSLP